MKKTKVLLITHAIAPYRIPLFNSIYQLGDFDFKVITLVEKEKNREWEISKDKIKFDYQVLPGWHFFIWTEKKEIPIHLNRKALKTIWRYNPDVIITAGYDSPTYGQAFLYCKLFRRKFILWVETSLLSADNIKGIRGILKRIIVRGADRYVAFGTKAKEYLEYLGARPEHIYIGTNTVDISYFRKKTFQYRSNKNFQIERQLYPKYLLLYVGQLIKRKGIVRVLKALSYLHDSNIGFFIVGNGPLEKELNVFCAENKLQNIFFEGFRQQEELPKYYALADIFILPSFKEVWGLVVNEALASGLYVFCSKFAGAAHDLIKKEQNGEIFDPNNIEELVVLIKQAKDRIETFRNQREAISKQVCDEFSIKDSAKVFVNAIKEVRDVNNR